MNHFLPSAHPPFRILDGDFFPGIKKLSLWFFDKAHWDRRNKKPQRKKSAEAMLQGALKGV